MEFRLGGKCGFSWITFFRVEILPRCLHINCLVFNGASNGVWMRCILAEFITTISGHYFTAGNFGTSYLGKETSDFESVKSIGKPIFGFTSFINIARSTYSGKFRDNPEKRNAHFSRLSRKIMWIKIFNCSYF